MFYSMYICLLFYDLSIICLAGVDNYKYNKKRKIIYQTLILSIFYGFYNELVPPLMNMDDKSPLW